MSDVSIDIVLPSGAKKASTLASIIARTVYVEDFGGVADCVVSTNGTLYSATGTDNGPAFQAAIASLGTMGGRVLMKTGSYLIKTAITLNSCSVTIEGQGADTGPGGSGSWIVQEPSTAVTGFHVFTIGGAYGSSGSPSTSGTGSVFRRFGFYQCHPDPAANPTTGWAPNAYDYCINVQNMFGGFYVDEVMFLGVNKGVYAFGCGHFYIGQNWIAGQFFSNGVTIGNCEDGPYIGTARAYPYLWNSYASVFAYTQANADFITLGRCDGIEMDRIFTFTMRYGIHLIQESAITNTINSNANTPGGCSNGSINVLTCDDTQVAFFADNLNPAGTPEDWQIGSICTDGYATSSSIPMSNSFAVIVNSLAWMIVQISNLYAYGLSGPVVRIMGNTNYVQIGNLIARDCNHLSTSAGVPVGISGTPIIDVCDNGSINGVNRCAVANEIKISFCNGAVPFASSKGLTTPFFTQTSSTTYAGNGTWSDTPTLLNTTSGPVNCNYYAYTAVSIANSTQTIGRAFTTVVMNNVSSDNGSNFSKTLYTYTAKYSGVYEFTTILRIEDGITSGVSYGQGVDTTPQDSPNFIWAITNPSRNGSINTRKMALTTGQTVTLFAYIDSTVPLQILEASMMANMLFKIS